MIKKKEFCQCSKCLGRQDKKYSKKTRNLHFRTNGMWIDGRRESQSIQMSPEISPDIQPAQNNDMIDIGISVYHFYSYLFV